MKRRILITMVLAAVIVVIAGGVGAGWYYSNELKEGALIVSDAPSPPDLVVAAVAGDTITLQATEAADLQHGPWRAPGEWGLAWDGGYARVGAIVDLRGDSVVRSFTPVRGAVSAGTHVRIDGPAFEGDPLTARGLSFRRVTYPGELGLLGAWRIPGVSSTWAIFVHGMGQTGKESLRFLPPFTRAGLPVLVIEYRNDTGDPLGERLLRIWRERVARPQAAVRYAMGEGAKHICSTA
jgi:hypothetical protein